jgi:cold shock CspA family protein
MSEHGTIRRLVAGRGFGFIQTGQGEDLFFHRSACRGIAFEDLQPGQAIEYEVGTGRKGPQAITVRPREGGSQGFSVELPRSGPVQRLISEAQAARERVLAVVGGLRPAQAAFKPGPDRWSIQEVVEHLTLAEDYGVNAIWRAAEGVRAGQPVWAGEHTNRGLSIEEVVARTWRPREVAPDWVTPRSGGPIAYWLARYRACGQVLPGLGPALDGLDLEAVIFPHPMSGPLDATQRLAFLRFHADRHLQQIAGIKASEGYPV